MRLSTVIVFLAIVQVSAASYGQKVTYLKKDITLVKLFKEIKKQTGLNVVWYEETLDATRLVGARFKDAPIEEVMGKALTGLHLSYTISKNTVVIKEKERSFVDKIVDAIHSLVKDIHVRGSVTDEYNKPISGATVKIKGTTRSAITDTDGKFYFENVKEKAVLVISYLGYKTMEIEASEELPGIRLVESMSELAEVQVVNTGFQKLPKERATGSFTVIDNKLINRSVSSDLLSRLKGVTNGLLFDKKTGNPTGISIRGRSTLFSNTTPLIVIDNFPFEGDINTINPNDIENVTLLKDAAAASIWGVRAGNGVIVITTKKGKTNQKTNISFNANVTIGDKPDLDYIPQLSSSEFIDVEQYLFDQGKYASALRRDYTLISPIVTILQKQSLNQLSSEQARKQIDVLRSLDIRDQQNEYFYRKNSAQQYHLNISGGGTNQTYYFSGGYDKNLPNAVGNNDSRITLKGSNTYSLLNDKLKLTTDITFTKSQATNTNGYGYVPLYPYEQVSDAKGNALSTLASGVDLRSEYTDTAGNGNLLDWKYRPLDELRSHNNINKSNLTDYRILLGADYKIFIPLTISLNYQYYDSNQKGEISFNQQSYYTRNLINSVSQINSSTGYVIRPIPFGDIYIPSFNINQSDYGRAQLNFNQTLAKHDINAIAGYEIRNERSKFNQTTLYGYFPETATNSLVDYVTTFPSYYGPGAKTIQLGNNSLQNTSTNRYISYYWNASYMYDRKYILSGSYRKDESNLFGVKANQKGVPLWSIGTAWNIDKEDFFDLNWFSKLQLRGTYGYNGNVNKSVSAYLTASAAGASPLYNSNTSNIVNPPNDALRWERVKNINFGFDFSTKNDRISGSIEYYLKNGIDLIGKSPIAPQIGVSIFTGNSADTHTNGVDIQINSINVNGKFKWNTTGIFNFVKDKVIVYKAQKGINSDLVSEIYGITPLVGYPINSIFGLKWAGLDDSGAPRGLINGVQSKDYTSILNSVNPLDADFFGSAVPTVFGSIRNAFSYKNFELSFNIIYKFNYFFRRNSLNYASLFDGDYQQADYRKRWQKKGDELITSVPSALYPIDNNRNEFYRFSSILVEKGDQIRLEDIQLNYTFTKTRFKGFPFSNLNIYIYVNNLGILWKANKQHLDPDVESGYPVPKTISFGLNTNF